MRSLSVGNKREFTIFTMVIILIIGVFIISLNIVLASEDKEYTVNENTITFDEEYNAIELEQEGKLYQKWDKNFYVKVGESELKLGKKAIFYNQSRNKLNIYGDTFEVISGGEVIKYLEQNEIIDLSEDRLFKLEDRKYLVIGSSIENETQSIDTKNFLIINLDRTGNTLLANYELNMKTIKPMKINTESYVFDVANEKLIFEEEEIDLKKIIGSTNEYKEIVPPEENEEIDENDTPEEETDTKLDQIEAQNIIQGSQNNPINSENNTGTTSGGTQNAQTVNSSNNAGGTTQQSQIQSQVQTQVQTQTQSQEESKNVTPLAKSINLRGITARSTSLDVQYAILDTENKYQTVFLDIQGDIQKTIALDKSQRNYLVTGLTPNTEYKVTLAYKEILSDNTIQDGVEDTIIMKTSKIADSITINKLAQSKLYFTYKMDPNYVYDSGKIAVYVDGEKQAEMDINIESAITQNGWKTNVKYTYGNEIIVKLENATYEGKEIKRDLQTKLRLY